jgi:hypothetical protein
MPAQLDHGAQLAATVEGGANRGGGRFVYGEHQPFSTCTGTYLARSAARGARHPLAANHIVARRSSEHSRAAALGAARSLPGQGSSA